MIDASPTSGILVLGAFHGDGPAAVQWSGIDAYSKDPKSSTSTGLHIATELDVHFDQHWDEKIYIEEQQELKMMLEEVGNWIRLFGKQNASFQLGALGGDFSLCWPNPLTTDYLTKRILSLPSSHHQRFHKQSQIWFTYDRETFRSFMNTNTRAWIIRPSRNTFWSPFTIMLQSNSSQCPWRKSYRESNLITMMLKKGQTERRMFEAGIMARVGGIDNGLDHPLWICIRGHKLSDSAMVQSDLGSRYAPLGVCFYGCRIVLVSDVWRSWWYTSVWNRGSL